MAAAMSTKVTALRPGGGQGLVHRPALHYTDLHNLWISTYTLIKKVAHQTGTFVISFSYF